MGYCEQDHDGSHIKGLIINFIDQMFPSLLDIPGFLLEFITPIIRVSQSKKTSMILVFMRFVVYTQTDKGTDPVLYNPRVRSLGGRAQ